MQRGEARGKTGGHGRETSTLDPALPSRSQVVSGKCPCLGPSVSPAAQWLGWAFSFSGLLTRHLHIQWTQNHHSQIGPFSTFLPTTCNSENVGPLPKASKLWPKRKVQGSADRKCRSWTPGFNLRSVLEFSLSNHPTPQPSTARHSPARQSVISAIARPSGRLQQNVYYFRV